MELLERFRFFEESRKRTSGHSLGHPASHLKAPSFQAGSEMSCPMLKVCQDTFDYDKQHKYGRYLHWISGIFSSGCFFLSFLQGALKRDNRRQTTPKGRFSPIFAGFCRFSNFPGKQSIWKTLIFAEAHWFPHETAENRRNLQKIADWGLSPSGLSP